MSSTKPNLHGYLTRSTSSLTCYDVINGSILLKVKEMVQVNELFNPF